MRTLLTQKFCLVCNMQGLDLYNNQIGDTGMISLADALRKGALPKCTVLFLGGNQIGDVGMSALATAIGSGALDKIKSIYLSETPGSSTPVDNALRERSRE
jgi:hypothetical protein